MCLKKWFNLSFTEVNLIVKHSLASENSQHITKNTIQSIEHFVHLKNKYRLSVEEYVSLINRIPVYSVDNGATSSFFDKVFNKLSSNFPFDDVAFDINKKEARDNEIVNMLSSSLGLSLADFQTIAKEIIKSNNTNLSMNLKDISSLYRTVRISSLFGFTPVELISICRVLTYKPEDLEDCGKLYRLEIFSYWLKENKLSPVFLGSLIQNAFSDLITAKEVLDFVVSANIEIINSNNKEGNRVDNSILSDSEQKKALKLIKEENILKVVAPLLESLYSIEKAKIPLIFQLMNVKLSDFINETIKHAFVKKPEEISIEYLRIHENCFKYSLIINFFRPLFNWYRSFFKKSCFVWNFNLVHKSREYLCIINV